MGRRGLHYLQTRRVHVGHFDVLRMERAAVDVAAGRSADDHGYRLAPAVAALGREVGDLVEAAGHEVCELHFEDWAQSIDGGSGASAHDARLSEGGVHHTQLAEAFQHALGDLERTAVSRHVLAHHEDRVIAFHLLPDALADCFDIGCFCHGGGGSSYLCGRVDVVFQRRRIGEGLLECPLDGVGDLIKNALAHVYEILLVRA